MVCLLGWFGVQSLSASTIVTITNDWASARVEIVSPKPENGPPPPGYSWSDVHQGEAVASLSITQSGVDPINSQSFNGSATARIGPTVNVGSYWGNGPDSMQLFASYLLVDDSLGCEAESIVESFWRVTVTGDSIPFYAGGLVEFGHSMSFSLMDFSTGQEVFSKSISGSNGFNQTGMLESSHEYLLILNQSARFGGGDGTVRFEFGFDAPAQIDFADNRTHLAIPESSTLTLICVAAALGLRRRR